MISAIAFVVLLVCGAVLLGMARRGLQKPEQLKIRFAAPPRAVREGLPIAPERLAHLVAKLLGEWGMQVTTSEPLGRRQATRLVAARHDRLSVARHVVYIEPSPWGGVVRASVLDELADDVRQSGAAGGILFTPYRIDAAGARDLELVDGLRLSQLLQDQLPDFADEVRRYRFTGRMLPSPT